MQLQQQPMVSIKGLSVNLQAHIKQREVGCPAGTSTAFKLAHTFLKYLK